MSKVMSKAAHHVWLLLAVSVLVVLLGTRPVGSVSQEGGKNSGTIIGRVVDRSTGAPVPQVVVSLTGSGRGAVGPRVRTSTTGQFIFRELGGGQWALRASKPGWFSARDGSRSVELKPGELVANVQLALDRSVAIGGTVTDDRGDPIVGVEVRLLGTSVEGRWTSVASTETDDRGQYRFFNRGPGRYLILAPSTQVTAPAGSDRLALLARDPALRGAADAADDAGPAALRLPGVISAVQFPGAAIRTARPGPNGRNHLYATTFHPSALDAGEATIVTLTGGSERSDVDIHIRPVAATSVSGVLVGQGGPPPASKVRLVARGASFAPDVAVTISGQRGEFEFPLVPVGSYDIVVEPEAATEAPAQITTVWTRHTVQVGPDPIMNLRVPLQAGRTISGRIEFRGTRVQPIPEQLQRAQVTLRRVDAQGVYRGPVNADRTFEVRNLPGGWYQVAALNVPGWPLLSATADGRDLADVPVNLASSYVTDVVITLTDTYPELRGAVRDKGGTAASGATVLVFPTDRKLWTEFVHTSRRVRETVSFQDGSYSFASLPPGEYFIVAVQTQLAAWRRADVLEDLARFSTRFNLPDRGTTNQDMTTAQVDVGRTRTPAAADLRGGTGSGAAAIVNGQGPFVADVESGTHVDTDVGSIQKPPQSGVNTGTVAGRIVRPTDDNAAVRAATVTLSARGGVWSATTLTDDAGAFIFEQVPQGRYRVSASKAAYLPMQFGARSSGRPGTSFVLADGARMGINMVLPKGAVITGVVTDALGAPLSTARVRALRAVDRQGARHVESVAGARPIEATTNDRGEYRIYGLPSGRYYVGVTPGIGGLGVPARQVDDHEVQPLVGGAAGPTPPGTAQSRDSEGAPTGAVLYGSVFYPQARRLIDGLPVDLQTEEQREGVNIQLELVPSVTLTGRVLSPDGLPPRNGVVSLRPSGDYVPTEFRGVGREGTGVGGSLGGYVQARTTSDGRFTINALTPGIYDLLAGGTPATAEPASRPTWWATDSLTIAGTDVRDYGITLRPGGVVAGVLRGPVFRSDAPVDGFRLTLVPAVRDELAAEVPLPGLAKDGSFRFDAVPPGVYRLRVESPKGSAPHSALLDGRDLLDETLQLFSGQLVEGIVVNVSDLNTLALLDGVFSDEAGRPASEYFVVVFPVRSDLWEQGSRRIRSLRPGTDGRFEASGLPAGDYFVAAVWDVEPDEWYKPSFLQQLVAAAVKVTLVDGARTTQHLRVAGRRPFD